MRAFYSIIFYLLLPVILLRLLWRSIKAPAYAERLAERLGFGARLARRPRIWLHAVSVGETLAAAPLVRELLARYPEHHILLTTTTPTGSERVRALFADEPRIEHRYAPYDLPDALARFLRRTRPELLVVMETELWPNTIAACRARGVAVVVANARLSAKSARGYRRFGALTRPMLEQIDCVAAQNAADARRFVELGLPESQLQVTGSIKFDLQIDDDLRQRAAELKTQLSVGGRRKVWLAASTHAGEDEPVLDAFAEVRKTAPETLLVLVPRHPERFDAVAELCRARGFNTERRSQQVTPSEAAQVFVGDTMGELLLFYGACDLAFVGGSFANVGGHNLIEPAAWQVPVLSGPVLHNFADVARLLREAEALVVCENAEVLAREVRDLLNNSVRAEQLAAAAKQVAEDNRGALARLLGVIAERLDVRRET